MGASHSQHVRGTLKITDGGENVRVKYATSSMQGWCAKMEDAVSNLQGLLKIIERIVVSLTIYGWLACNLGEILT
jgi:hypothetical protein